MRLISKTDTSLAVGLVIGAVILFDQPLRFVLDWARNIEGDYHLDLVPALVVLTGLFAFQQLRKRRQSQTEMLAAAAEARQHLARTRELEALVGFGHMLASALDIEGLRYGVSRGLPGFAAGRGMWVLIRRQSIWHTLSIDPVIEQEMSRDELERTATLALLARQTHERADSEGVGVESSLCFPLVVGSTIVGVLGVQQTATALNGAARQLLGVAASLLSIAVRNVNLLVDTKEVSLHDPLTGCLLRTPGLEKLETELRRVKRSNLPLSVLMLDVDQFKQINDRYGHLCGDLVLGGIGRHLVQTLRGSDIKCRFGGDEFILVLPDTPLHGAQQVATGIRKAIEGQAIEHHGHHVFATVSIGIACADAGEIDVKALIDRADRALYQAKESGRNRSCGVPEPGADVADQPSTTPSKGFVAHDLGLTA
jgi:diguanylate cyclase (GGDEF)-like protein